MLNQTEMEHIKALGFEYALGPFAAAPGTPEELAAKMKQLDGGAETAK